MKKLTLPAAISVKDLAERLNQSGAAVVKYLMTNGVMASLNETIDYETAALVADSFGIETESEEAAAAPGADGVRRKHPLLDTSGDDPATLKERAPVVTVLGHVDHGKTSLLDAIRKTKVAAGEAGGITQVIRAHQVESNGKPITFIDTPGHAAFTEMRRRGADVTDIAVLVVAADDGIMPQTEEAIQHAKAAGVPIVVAMNKIDKDGANPDRILQQLVEHGLNPVEWGGNVEVVRTSAKKGTGIDTLLATILLVSEADVHPTANPDKPTAVGTVVESNQDAKRGGVVATVLVQSGTLKVGAPMVAGTVFGKVRALFDDSGHRLKEAGPSVPVLITGLPTVVGAGELLQTFLTEREARALADQRLLTERKLLTQPVRKITLADLANHLAEGEMKSLNLVLKAEANGSLEALRGQIDQIEDPAVRIKIVGDGVGPVGEADVNLAAVTDSIVIGFNVRPDDRARAAADEQGVDVRYYDVVYQVTDDIVKAIKGLYEPTFIEVFQGRAEVRKVYTVDGKNAIGGSNVLDGKITRNAVCRVMRDGKEIAKGKVSALKRFKDDVREVAKGYDCGISIEDFADFAEGDLLEAFVVEQQNL